eukprot:2012453-Rhodomonas_salina.3
MSRLRRGERGGRCGRGVAVCRLAAASPLVLVDVDDAGDADDVSDVVDVDESMMSITSMMTQG